MPNNPLITYAIYLTAIILIFLITFNAFQKPMKYEVSINDPNIFDDSTPLYIDGGFFGSITSIRNEAVRLIKINDFNVIFNFKRNFDLNVFTIFEIEFVDKNSELRINNELIVPNLTNYDLIADYNDFYIFVRKDLNLENRDYYLKSQPAVGQFLQDNFSGKSLYSFKKVNFDFPLIADYCKCTTDINSTFRGKLTLAIYSEGDLAISFKKQDLQMYSGQDEYTLKIKDFSGNEVYSKVLTDDGDATNSDKVGYEQQFDINLLQLRRSIYFIQFLPDKFNEYEDSTIKDIHINSNKILIVGQFLPWGQFNFYTATKYPKKISFYSWLKYRNQEIKYLDGISEKSIMMDNDWLDKKRELYLLSDKDYYFSMSVGYIVVDGVFVSPKKENWFNLVNNSEDNFIGQDLVLIDKEKCSLTTNGLSCRKNILVNNGKNIINIRTSKNGKIYLKKIELTLVK